VLVDDVVVVVVVVGAGGGGHAVRTVTNVATSPKARKHLCRDCERAG
jgi:hypothetical protein